MMMGYPMVWAKVYAIIGITSILSITAVIMIGGDPSPIVEALRTLIPKAPW